MVEIWRSPPAIISPPLNVEVAVEVLRIPPPVIVSPREETSPPPATERPPEAQVEVAEPVVTMVLVAVSPARERLPEIKAFP